LPSVQAHHARRPNLDKATTTGKPIAERTKPTTPESQTSTQGHHHGQGLSHWRGLPGLARQADCQAHRPNFSPPFFLARPFLPPPTIAKPTRTSKSDGGKAVSLGLKKALKSFEFSNQSSVSPREPPRRRIKAN